MPVWEAQRPYLSGRRALRTTPDRQAFVVKKIAHDQSRRNVARRRRRVAARHARAGHWGARPTPMLHAGRIGFEVGGNIDATCFGGIAPVHRLVSRLGLVERIDADLELLKVHLPYHESDHVLNMAYNEVFSSGGPL